MKNKNLLYKISAIVFALSVWQITAMLINYEILLATPLDVVLRLCRLIFQKEFLKTVAFSFFRISIGFLIAFFLGIGIATLAYRFKIIEYMLWPFVITIKSVPIASFIILCLIWLSFGQLTVFISFLIVFPVIYLNVLEGIKSTDNSLFEVSKIYNIPFKRQLLYMYIPSVKPFLISACSISIGMAWKAGVAAEVIGVVNGSIGAKLYDAKIYFQNADLLAWTVVIILISVLTEKLFIFILKSFFKAITDL